jgi:hypothetical protein
MVGRVCVVVTVRTQTQTPCSIETQNSRIFTPRVLSLARVGEAARGLRDGPPEVDEDWRGRTISKSRIPLAGRKIKTLHWCPLRRTVARF